MNRLLAATCLLVLPLLPTAARAHDVHLAVRHSLDEDQAAVVVEIFDLFNHKPGHPTDAAFAAPDAEAADVLIADPADVATGAVVALDRYLDDETRAGYLPDPLATCVREGHVIGLPLTADGSLAAFVLAGTEFPREAFDLVEFLTGPRGAGVLARLEGFDSAHRAAQRVGQ